MRSSALIVLLVGCTPDEDVEFERVASLEENPSTSPDPQPSVEHPCVDADGGLLYGLQPASGWPQGVGTGAPMVHCRDGGALLGKVFRYDGSYYTDWRSEHWQNGYGMEYLDDDSMLGGESLVDATGSFHPSYVGFPMGDVPIPEGSRLKFEVVHRTDSGTRAFWYKDIPPESDLGMWIEEPEQSWSETCPAANPGCGTMSQFTIEQRPYFRSLQFGFGLPDSTQYGIHAFMDNDHDNNDSSGTASICSDTLYNSPESAWNASPNGMSHFGHGMRIWLTPPE